jgi:hypothetical protein
MRRDAKNNPVGDVITHNRATAKELRVAFRESKRAFSFTGQRIDHVALDTAACKLQAVVHG